MKNFKEIGSEFWLECPNEDKGSVYVLSGRTAIDLILQDMAASECHMNAVYMPAWCCDSMLQPFKDRSVNICFYDVSYENGHLSYHIDFEQQADIFFVTNYFGFKNTISEEVIQNFKERGCVVIYDRTHSLFQEDDKYVDLADYSFASIRKWMGVPCGAYVSKKNRPLLIPPLNDYLYLSEKVDAMKLKAGYIHGDTSIPKQVFLNYYNTFSLHLAESYQDFKMDDLSLYLWLRENKANLKMRRKENAAFLLTHLKDIPQVQTMCQELGSDCCLFVPIFFETEEERERVRSYLISKSIYCPIHWPKPNIIKNSMRVNGIYNHELSLICDQRYDVDDMSRILDTMKEVLDNY